MILKSTSSLAQVSIRLQYGESRGKVEGKPGFEAGAKPSSKGPNSAKVEWRENGVGHCSVLMPIHLTAMLWHSRKRLLTP